MDFQSEKSFGKLRIRAFQPYHQILCMLKHVKDVFDIFDIALIFCTVFNAFNAMYLNTSNIKQCALTHIDMCPLMYTQQIR